MSRIVMGVAERYVDNGQMSNGFGDVEEKGKSE